RNRIGDVRMDRFNRADEAPGWEDVRFTGPPVRHRVVTRVGARRDGEADAIGEDVPGGCVVGLRNGKRLTETFERGVTHELRIVDADIARMRAISASTIRSS
ncbi:hypothetical protein, partial [Paraburkholderia ginsengiterrae]|uniref:hypothetical protein n=1 Tax=Paraburkholderia ginsengiterrae TaxID=1462993 RepID=UPI001A9686E0